jgi:hypothetical protein
VVDGSSRRRRPVLAPHDHGNVAHFAVGNPADVVLVVPRGQPGRFAQIACRPTRRWSAHGPTVGRRRRSRLATTVHR